MGGTLTVTTVVDGQNPAPADECCILSSLAESNNTRWLAGSYEQSRFFGRIGIPVELPYSINMYRGKAVWSTDSYFSQHFYLRIIEGERLGEEVNF